MTWPNRRPAWRDGGSEPDLRYSLANERTYLAWVRTALALLAGSIGVEHFAPGDKLPALRTAVAIALAVIGVIVTVVVYAQWKAVERAAREGRPMPHSPLPAFVAVVMGLVGVAVLVLVAVG